MSSSTSRTAVFKNTQTPAQKYGLAKPVKVIKPVEPVKYEMKKSVVPKKLPDEQNVKSVEVVVKAVVPVAETVVAPVIETVVAPVPETVVAPVVETVVETVAETVVAPTPVPETSTIANTVIEPVVLSLEKVNELTNSNIVIENN